MMLHVRGTQPSPFKWPLKLHWLDSLLKQMSWLSRRTVQIHGVIGLRRPNDVVGSRDELLRCPLVLTLTIEVGAHHREHRW
jgi:hypothetical protein